MLTFNQIWWSTRTICDRYFEEAATPPESQAGAAGIADLLWEGGFLEMASEETPAGNRTLEQPVHQTARSLHGIGGGRR